nr:MAG TPA: minor capsid protein [Microviridae sp.]
MGVNPIYSSPGKGPWGAGGDIANGGMGPRSPQADPLQPGMAPLQKGPNMVPPMGLLGGGSGVDYLGAAATIGSGIMGYMGGESANTANAEQAAKNREFNAQQADITRKWQEQMRGSAYQSTMDDMRKAGLNPMSAFQQGGTGTPSGSTASGSNAAPMQNTLGQGASSAVSAAQTISNLRTADAQQTLMGAQALTAVAQANRETTSSHLNEEQTHAIALDSRKKKQYYETDKAEAGYRKKQAEVDQEAAARQKIIDQVGQVVGTGTNAYGAVKGKQGLDLERSRQQLDRDRLKPRHYDETEWTDWVGSPGQPMKRRQGYR